MIISSLYFIQLTCTRRCRAQHSHYVILCNLIHFYFVENYRYLNSLALHPTPHTRGTIDGDWISGGDLLLSVFVNQEIYNYRLLLDR